MKIIIESGGTHHEFEIEGRKQLKRAAQAYLAGGRTQGVPHNPVKDVVNVIRNFARAEHQASIPRCPRCTAFLNEDGTPRLKQ